MTVVTQSAHRAYEAWHDRFGVDIEAEAPWHTLVKTHLDDERDVAGKRILEIGCGRGGFACWIAQRNNPPAKIVAADFAHAAINKARAFASARGIHCITWEVGDIQKIAHPERSFDTVFSCETIEHVPDPRAAIRELVRVLRPGGRLFLTTPNYLGPMGLYRAYMRITGRRYTEEGQPINNFVLLPRTRAWVARSGLRVSNVDAVGHYLPFPGRPPIELPILNNPKLLTRWFGLHSLIVGEKP